MGGEVLGVERQGGEGRAKTRLAELVDWWESVGMAA